MSKYRVTAPDGTSWEVNAPDDATQEQVMAYAQSQWSQQQPERTGMQQAGHYAGLANRSIAQGVASLPLTVADLAAWPFNAVSRSISGQELIPSYTQTFNRGLDEINKIAPVFASPETKGEELASSAIRGASSAAGGVGLGQQLAQSTSPVVAGVGNILQSSPGVQAAAGGSAGASGELARQAGFGPAGQTIASFTGGLAGGLAADRVASAFRPPARPPIGRTAPAAQSADDVLVAAKESATKAGLQWDNLDDALRDRILRNVDDALTVDSKLPPEALARKAFYESLGIKPTKALITRNFDDALQEQNLLTEPEGNALRQLYAQNNRIFRENIKQLQPEGVNPVDQPTFGQRFREPVATGERMSQARANQAFERAMAAEGGNRVARTPLDDYLQQNAGRLAKLPATKPVFAELKRMGLLKDQGQSYTDQTLGLGAPKPMTLKDLSGLRGEVNRAWKTSIRQGDSVAEGRLNELRQVLNGMEESAGGELFKAYRQIRSAKGARYEDNPLIDKLISDKKGYYGTDMIEDSKVFSEAILNSSSEQFAKTWPRLTPKAKDLTRAQVARYIEERSFGNTGTNEAGDIVASAAKLNQALDNISPQKMRLIYGQEQADRIQRLNTAVREISNPPRGTVPQGSAPKLTYLTRGVMSLLARKVPVVGDAAVRGLENAARARANEALMKQILTPIPAPAPTPVGLLEPTAPLLLPILTNTQNR